ncbi:MAG: nucleotide exchange factor GrpE [Clostridia bacterium]|nr:nucleotide exchange factor GrpE [Clostridia bacterium]
MDEKKRSKKLQEELSDSNSKNESATAVETEELKKEIETLKAQVEEFKDKWMRNVAEFDNYKKRTAKNWQEAFNEGIASVIVKILPVGDNLEWALTLGLDEKTEEGIRGIKRKYDETLSGMEIEEINPIGEPFDPNVAEAVMQVPAEDGDVSDTVKQVFQKGYRKKDKIIRYAKVSVIK